MAHGWMRRCGERRHGSRSVLPDEPLVGKQAAFAGCWCLLIFKQELRVLSDQETYLEKTPDSAENQP